MKATKHYQKKLADLIVALIENERNLDQQRMVVTKSRYFSLNSIFQKMDFRHRNCVNKDDLFHFLQINSISSNPSDLQWLIDEIKYSYISKNKKNQGLGDYIKTKHLKSLSNNKKDEENIFEDNKSQNQICAVDPETEYEMAKLFYLMLQNKKIAQQKQKNLNQCPDFDSQSAFLAIDSSNFGMIDNQSLIEFMEKKGKTFSSQEGDILIFRYGNQEDGIINTLQFNVMIGCNQLTNTLTPSILPKELTQVKQISFQPIVIDEATNKSVLSKKSNLAAKNGEKSSNQNLQELSNVKQSSSKQVQDLLSPNLEKDQSLIPSINAQISQKQQSQNEGTKENNQLQQQQETENQQKDQNLEQSNKLLFDFHLSNLVEKEETFQSPTKQPEEIRRLYSPKKLYNFKERQREMNEVEENFFIKCMCQIVEGDGKVEEIKQELAVLRDFSLLGAYKLIDVSQRGRITQQELFFRFKELGLNVNKQSVYLFFKEYDIDFSGKLEFQEFARIISPLENNYRGIVGNKIMENGIQMSASTELIFLSALEIIMENLLLAESIKQQLNKRRMFSEYQAFCAIDANKNGYITPQDFREIFVQHNRHFTPKQILYFFRRFDKELDGQLSYGQFFSELSPKCSFVIQRDVNISQWKENYESEKSLNEYQSPIRI